jgi:hypothetical protein
MLSQPRDSPPTETEFESFCRDVDQRGFGKALRELLDIDKKQFEGGGEDEGYDDEGQDEGQDDQDQRGEEQLL